MSNFFGSSSSNNEATQVELGSRLYNIKQSSIGTESVLSILPDNNVVVNTCSSFGKSLLNVSSLNGLVGLLNSADSKVEVIDSGTGSIDFTLDNALKLSVKNAYTEVLNELRSLNIIPATDLQYDLGTSTKRYGTGFIRKITTNSVGQVSIGDGASTLGTSSVNIGNGSGGSGEPNFSVSIGRGANSEQSHTASICLGYASGQKGTTQRSGIVAIGHSAGTGISSVQGMMNNAIAIGSSASLNGGAVDSIAIGAGANGNSVANDYSIAIGSGAGSAGQGNHCIAIGRLAGQANQHNSTIIINGQNNTALNSTGTDRCHIAPIRSGGTGNNLVYDTGTKEVLVGGNATVANIFTNHIYPNGTDSYDMGTGVNQYRNIYANSVRQFSATNPLKFFTNSDTERMTILSNGNVGIGTSNPQNQLNIEKAYGGALNEAGSMTLSTISGSTSWGCGAISAYVNAGLNNNNSSFPGGLLFKTKSIGNSDFTLTTRMVIDALGNLGLNNTAPQERLDVSGNVKITGNILFDADNQRSVGSSGQALSAIHCHTGNFKSIAVHSTTAGNIATSAKPFNTLFVSNIGSSGTPVQTLYADVWATSSTSGLRCANNLVLATDLSLPTITWYDVNAKSMIIVDTVNTTDGGKLSYDSANSEIVISTTSSNVERLRVGSNGLKSKRAIHNTDATSGITSTDSQLQLSGATKSQILFENTGNTSKKVIALYNSADKLCINSMDNTGTTYTASGDIIQFDMANGWIIVNALLRPTLDMGSDLGGTNKRWANGYFDKVYTTSGTVNTSDRNQKKDIQPLGDSLKQLLKLEPVSFKYKEGTSGRTHLGFIAQQVAEVIPDCAIFVQNGDSCGLRYEQFSALIVKAVQELHSKVEKIENRKLVGGSVIDTSSLTEDFVQIYQRLEAIESQPIRPTLHKCIEVSRFNQMYDRITNLEARLSAFDELKDSEESELVHNLMEKNNQLELKVNELETKLNNLPKTEAKCNDFLESDGGLNMNELLQQKNFELETRLIKLEKQNKRLVQAVNKLLKSNDV
jgi:hypothetical protein